MCACDSDWGCRPMYPECVAFLRKTMRVREIVVLVRLSHSHGFAQKRNAIRIYGTAPSEFVAFLRARYLWYSCCELRPTRKYGVRSPYTTSSNFHPLLSSTMGLHLNASWHLTDRNLLGNVLKYYDPVCLRVLAHSSLLLCLKIYFNRPRQYSQLPRMAYKGEGWVYYIF